VVNVRHPKGDPKIYGADAAHFDPERFLDTNGGVFPSPTVAKEEGHVTYGFQRSICAESTLRTLLRRCGQELGKEEHDNVTQIDVDRWVEDGLVCIGVGSHDTSAWDSRGR
ncbi:hypothetical protein BJY52DRAFT_1128764, partial [Lactarius psammicola]